MKSKARFFSDWPSAHELGGRGPGLLGRVRHWPAVFAISMLSVIACTGNQQRDGVTKIATLRGPSAVAMMQWIDSLANRGDATTEITLYDEPLQLRKKMLEGSVDFAILPTTMAALMYNGGVDYRIAAVPLWGTLYLCGTDTAVTSLTRLKGHRVHLMAKGMTPDILFRHLVNGQGIDPDTDIDCDYRFPTHIDLANAAIAGRTELCVLSEPYASQVENANPDFHILVDLGREWEKEEAMPLAETAFLCRGDLAGRETVEDAVKAFRRSAEWVNANPDSAAVLARTYGIGPDMAAIRRSIPNSHIKVKGTAEAENEIKSYLAIILKAAPDAVGKRMPDEDFYAK